MKTLSFFSLAGMLLLVGGAASAQQFTVMVTVDENGNGTLTNSAGFFSTLPFSIAPDPGPGGLPAVLTYGLLNPPGLVAGDVLLQDGIGGPILDVIRFNPQENGGSLVFYSDNTDGSDSLGDTPGPPTALYDNRITIQEIGPEGDNGAFYTPLAGQPGFVTGASGPVTYHFISDSVPEPGSIAMIAGLGVTGSLFAVSRLRRRRK